MKAASFPEIERTSSVITRLSAGPHSSDRERSSDVLSKHIVGSDKSSHTQHISLSFSFNIVIRKQYILGGAPNTPKTSNCKGFILLSTSVVTDSFFFLILTYFCIPYIEV